MSNSIDIEKKLSRIRNFSIIAHIDHGKSTLADRFLQICGAVSEREMSQQMLDSMSLEKEKGITIKAQTCNLKYTLDGIEYQLNLIDTPGHYDFSYEVNRSMAACENSILLIDGTQGVQAQTLSHLREAKKNNHFIIPVINKTDLPSTNIERCIKQLEKLGIDTTYLCKISAKSGAGVEDLIKTFIQHSRPPKSTSHIFRALVVDSWYDRYLGIVVLIRVVDGVIKNGSKIKSCSNGNEFNILYIGKFSPKKVYLDQLEAGEIGFLVTQLRNSSLMTVGDTLVESSNMNPSVLPGFKKTQALVFCTFYNPDPDMSDETHEALKKYQLNDSSFSFTVEKNDLHGIVFRCGFLGLLHLEIVRERLLREFDIDVTAAVPSVEYKVTYRNEEVEYIKNPKNWPSGDKILKTEEPEVMCTIMFPTQYVGPVLNLCNERRAEEIDLNSNEEDSELICRIPLAEIILNFNDKLLSICSGFASFEYELIGWRESDLGKLIIIVNEKVIEEFSTIVFSGKARETGGAMVKKLKDLIPRAQIAIKIQAAFNGVKNIVGREDISPYRKDVIAKCYGGDITRKKKLLEKQKKGKDKMLDKGEVEIPSSAYVEITKI